MLTAEEALTNSKRCVEDIENNGGEYYDRYMTMFEDAIQEAYEKYGSTYAKIRLDNVEIPCSLKDILCKAMNLLHYDLDIRECYMMNGRFCTDISI